MYKNTVKLLILVFVLFLSFGGIIQGRRDGGGATCSGEKGYSSTTDDTHAISFNQPAIFLIWVEFSPNCGGTAVSMRTELANANSTNREIEFVIYTGTSSNPDSFLAQFGAIYDGAAADQDATADVIEDTISQAIAGGSTGVWIGFATEYNGTELKHNTTGAVTYSTRTYYSGQGTPTFTLGGTYPATWPTADDTEGTLDDAEISITF